MKILVVLSAVVACSMGQYLYALPYPPVVSHHIGLPIPYYTPVSSQYHAQDELGQFTFGHTGDNQARAETKTVDGSVRGAYSYIDPNGKVINVHYLADHNGYRVLGANNLPEAPAAPDVKGPEPVQDTAEVEAAKAEFQKKFDEASSAAEATPEDAPEAVVSRKRRGAVLLPSLLGHPALLSTPVLSKTTVKIQQYQPVDAATPADTKKIELKEAEHQVLTPAVHYSAVVPTIYGQNVLYV